MGQKIAGTCYVKVDGAQLTIKGGCEAPLMEVNRTTLVPGYYKEEERRPSLKVTVVMASPLSSRSESFTKNSLMTTSPATTARTVLLAGRPALRRVMPPESRRGRATRTTAAH